MMPLRTEAKAYPRMHGGTALALSANAGVKGLSPHARGNRLNFLWRLAESGPIPACTGEPGLGTFYGVSGGAYPRMHGGT